ncbi:MAG: 4Fe-4S binding protein [Thermodesulfobacteriota bacterium]|nr:4Fe-4S binding protein [Thermodesulfobacteriota bacterium]
MKRIIKVDREFCKGCEICISFCPQGVITLSETINASGYLPVLFLDTGECTGCATCAVVCPEVAIEVYSG